MLSSFPHLLPRLPIEDSAHSLHNERTNKNGRPTISQLRIKQDRPNPQSSRRRRLRRRRLNRVSKTSKKCKPPRTKSNQRTSTKLQPRTNRRRSPRRRTQALPPNNPSLPLGHNRNRRPPRPRCRPRGLHGHSPHRNPPRPLPRRSPSPPGSRHPALRLHHGRHVALRKTRESGQDEGARGLLPRSRNRY
jgi:hypothetical protein